MSQFELIQASVTPLLWQLSKQNPIHLKPFSTHHEMTSYWKASTVTFHNINA